MQPPWVVHTAVAVRHVTTHRRPDAAELVGHMFPQEAPQWRYLGEEAGLSRIYGGIHYPSDERAGNQMGKRIGVLAVQRDQLNGP